MVVDRIEELLALVADEDGEGQEDVLALGAAIPVLLSREDGGDPAPAGELGREGEPLAGERAGQARAVEPEAGGAARAESLAWSLAGTELTRERWGQEGREAAQRTGTAWGPDGVSVEETGRAAGQVQAVERVAGGTEETDGDGDRWALTLDGAGGGSALAGLYRQAVQGARPSAPALPAARSGQEVRWEGAEEAAALSVDELDRAVRRDSRRYDGGMSIF